MEVHESPIVRLSRGEEKEGNTEVEKIHVLEEVPGLECLGGRQYEKTHGTPTAGPKEGTRGPYTNGLEKSPDLCIHSPGEEPSGSDCLAGRLSSRKKDKKTKKSTSGSEEKEETLIGGKKGVDEADQDLVGGKKGGGSEQTKGVWEEPKEGEEKVPVKKKSRLVEKGVERKKSKYHGTAGKMVILGKGAAPKVQDEGDEEEQVEEPKEVKQKEVAEAEKVAVKKGQSSGSKKRKKIVGVEKEVKEFPPAVENLYSAKATTLTALVKLSAGQGDDRSGVMTKA
jgi:hypothetical protein